MMKVRTRYAPSPTGYMHIGNLRTALYAYLFARHNNGTYILRIEDTDRSRYVDDAIDVIYNSLKMANLDYDEGPDKGGKYGPYVQSERIDIYKKYAHELVDKGFAYYCFCEKTHEHDSKEENNFAGYDRHCRNLSKEEVEQNLKNGKPYVIRQKMPLDGETVFYDEVYGEIRVENSTLDDQILLKSDGMPTYNFANVIDDHLMGITHVMRGREYISSTPKYELLYKAFGWESPKIAHLSQILGQNEDGSVSKLSKRHGAKSFEDLVSEGYLTQAIINYVALLGWSSKLEREIFSLNELVDLFTLEGLVKSDSIFDYKKLSWFNSEYITRLSKQEFLDYTAPYIEKLPNIIKDNWLFLSDFMQTRISNANEFEEKLQFFYKYPDFDLELLINKKNKTNLENSKAVLIDVINLLQDEKDWTQEKLNNILSEYANEKGYKLGFVMWPVRIAVSGQTVTPCGSGEILYVLGKEESLRRMKETISRL